MDCGEFELLIARSVTGNAAASDESRLRNHLAACPACSAEDARQRRVWQLMETLRPAPLAEEQVRIAANRVRQARAARTWGIAAAAAVLLSIIYLIGRSPSDSLPQETPSATAPGAPDPVARPAADPTPEEIVRQNTADQLLTEVTQPKEPVPAAPPQPPAPPERPATVVQAPPVHPPEQKPATPPAPLPSPVVEKPAPPPAPAPENPPAPRETLPVIATLGRSEGAVWVVTGGVKAPAKAGLGLIAGQGVETGGAASQAVLEYEDGTRLALGPETILPEITERRAGEGKRVRIAQGAVAAQVAKQPPAEPMAFLTAHAECRVLGTRLALSVTAGSTRVEVREGLVRVIRKEDGATADLAGDHFAVAAKGVALTSKPIAGARILLREVFDRAKWGPAWAAGGDLGSGFKVANEGGALSVRAAQKVAGVAPAPAVPADPLKGMVDSVARNAVMRGDWPRAAWLETRQPAPFSNEMPLRLRARHWQSHAGSDRTSWLAVNRGTNQGLILERKGDSLQLLAEGAKEAIWKKEVPALQEWETLELWMSRDQLAVRRNDLTLWSGVNPLRARAVQFSVGAGARSDLAEEQEVRFDDLEAALMTRREFSEVTK
jgi:ferric-dicitrate binding protein FerR (iron transport regulator)